MIVLVSVIIPTLNEERNITRTLTAVRQAARVAGGRSGEAAASESAPAVEVLVVDGGSTDRTVALSRDSGARVICVDATQAAQNPALMRNRGAASVRGDLLVFLDADCEPGPVWLKALLDAHARGWQAVGGAFALPHDLPPSARCDYYAGWYNVHDRRAAGPAVSAPPGNLSILAATFRRTSGFDETPGVAYSHEELRLQSELRQAGIGLYFEPAAVVLHHNRAGVGNLLARHYRWGYAALESKATTGSARAAWIYRYPWALVAGALPLALPLSFYVVAQWLRAGIWQPVAWFPAILATRIAYGTGMMIGGARWLLHRPRLEIEAT